MIFKNYTELNKHIEARKNSIDMYTFDIFDTLLHRYTSPSCVLDALFKNISSFLFEKFGLIISEQEISLHRHEAYVIVAQVNNLNGYDFEVDYAKFVQEWSKLLLTDQCTKELEHYIKNQECFLECSVTYKSDGISYLLELASKQKKPIVLISDMYLPIDTIEQILNSCGYDIDVFDNIYVSSESKLMKKTGKLFEKVLSDYSHIQPSNIYHFGDNFEADGKMAKHLGINGIVIRDTAEFDKYESKEFLHNEYLKNPAFIGAYISSLYKVNFIKGSDLRVSIGSELLGPVLSSFCHTIIERCQRDNIKNVYFCAREGAVIKKVFDSIKSSLNSEINSYYLHTSRLSSFQASMYKGISNHHIKNSINNTGTYTLKNIFKPFGFDNDLLSSRAEFHGIEDVSSPLPEDFETWQPFINLVNDSVLNKECIALGKKVNDKFLSYLKELNFFEDDKVALVDVGWSGQIQSNIHSAIKGKYSVAINGYYFGTRSKAHETVNAFNKVEWIFGDESHMGWFSSPTLQDVFITETLTRACHPTVIGYTENGSNIVPMFKSHDESSRVMEAKFDPSLAMIQKASADYSDFYSIMNLLFSFDSTFSTRYARICLDRLVRFPTREMASLFAQIDNVSDLGSDEVNSLLCQNVNSFEIKRIPRSLWPYAQSVFFSNFVSLPYVFRRAFNYKAKYPRIPVFETVKIIHKDSDELSDQANVKLTTKSDFKEWNDILELSNFELSKNTVTGKASIDRPFIYKTTSLFLLNKVLRRIFKRKEANYYNDAISVKSLLLSAWFK